MNTKDRPTGRRALPTADRPEVRVVATARVRQPGRLDLAVDDPPDDPSVDAVVAAAAAHPGADGWMLAGGEALLRKDLPALLRALVDAGAPSLGLITDGLALATPGIPGALRKAGVQRVRVHLHAARADAHDWLVDQPGAWKRTIKGLRAAEVAGLELEIACTVTRPTAPYLDEAVDLFGKLGARAVVLRRVTLRGPAKAHDVAVSPRFGLTQRELETSVQAGVRAGLTMWLEGFPRCAAAGVAAHLLPDDAVAWALPAEGRWSYLAPTFASAPTERGCGTCPRDATCPGAPSDYIRRFGRTEIDSEGVKLVNPGKLEPTPLVGGEVYPPPRQGRFPPTRLSYARLAQRLPSLGGDPLVAEQRTRTSSVLRAVFLAPERVQHPALGLPAGPPEPEPTRPIRVRLVKAAQEGAEVLRVAGPGTLSHPEVAELLRECTRLQFPRIEVAGEASGLDGCTDMQLRRLRGITRIDVALFGPDAATHDAVAGFDGAFDAALRAVDRIGGLVPSIELGCYAVLTGPEHLDAFAEAWDLGDLPGKPWFRLAPRGGGLAALAEVADGWPAGPARDALAAVLPIALLARDAALLPAPEATVAWGDVPEALAIPTGCDRYGCYTGRLTPGPRPVAGEDPGVAVGWKLDG